MADNLPTLCWIADASGWIFWYNRRWHDYCGTTPEEMAGWGWQTVHDPEILPSVLKKWRSAIARGEPFEMVFPLRGRDGVFRPFLTRIEPWRNAEGLLERWFGMNTEISALQSAEREAREANERLELALNSGAIVGTWVWNVSEDHFTADERFARTFGLDVNRCRAGFTISYAKQSIHPEDLPQVEACLGRVLAHGGPYAVEYRVLTSAGEYRWIEANGRCELDASGRPVRFPGVLVDIHSRKLAEEGLSKAAAEADGAHRLLRTIIEEMPALIFKKDREGRLELANSSIADLVGKDWNVLQGMHNGEFLDAEQAAAITANDEYVRTTRQPIEVEELAGYRNGRPRVWLSRKAPFFNESGEFDGIIGASIEITDRKVEEESRALLMRELHHRVKNLFALTSAMVRMTARTAASAQEMAQTLVERLSALARAHDLVVSTGGEQERQPASLRQLLEIITAPHAMGQAQRVRLHGPEIHIKPEAGLDLALIVHELATNATKYGSLSVSEGTLEIKWSLSGAFLQLVWREQGGPTASRPGTAGFGSRLIEAALFTHLRGTLVSTWTSEGLEAVITATADAFEGLATLST